MSSSGPAYRLRELARGSHLILDAFDGYVLGRPKLDVIEARFILDSNTLLANLLAGAVEMTLSRTFSLDQARQLRDHWADGSVEYAPSFLNRISSQFVNPRPAVIADVNFRQALFYAMDRQELVDVIFDGMTSVPRSLLIPNRPQYPEVEAGVNQYAYDPGRAAQLIESLGYTKGGDGFYAAPGGQRLSNVELQATAGSDTREKMLFTVADQWQRAGVAMDILLVPQAQNQDREYRQLRPGFVLSGGGSDLDVLPALHSGEIPTPQNNYVGSNYMAWSNPRYDELYEMSCMIGTPSPRRLRNAGNSSLRCCAS